jgi:putative membrane protein
LNKELKLDNRQSARYPLTMLAVFFVALAISAIRPHDYFTWFLEVVPALLALPILFFTYRRFPLTNLLYAAILVHAVILLVGGHYTYAQEPVFNWIRDHFHLSRNYYDRVGHFAQGFVPALIAREVFIRQNVVKRGRWMFVVVLGVCLSVSAMYELFEWRVAVAEGSKADDFLGTQGDPWDTQEDMATCLVGALCALLLLSRFHDHQIEALVEEKLMPEERDPEVHNSERPSAPEPPKPLIRIRSAHSEADIHVTRELFVEYGQSLGFSLCFQNFDQEYASLPGKYAPPRGRLLLAEVDGRAAGCIALRPLEEGVCEMKRLYVRPEFRGLGLGRQLAENVIGEAKEIGYFAMRLDTVEDKMQSAVALYRALGFHEIGPYTTNPVPGAKFMQLDLSALSQRSLYGELS